VSPSPTWSTPAETPLFQALTAAQHDAWRAGPERGRTVFVERFRQLVGPARAEASLVSAIALFNLQPEAPAGFERPPTSTDFRICPRCQQLRAGDHNEPFRGRLTLRLLRDKEWLTEQLARGASLKAIAKKVGCTYMNVLHWLETHGLQAPKTQGARDLDAEVKAMHHRGDAPGTIAQALEIKVQDVRKVLERTGTATKKNGQHYHKAEWWVERIQRRGMTTTECAREAGIKSHGCAYWLKQFNLQHITKARSTASGAKRWKPKYPALANVAQLRALLDHHGSYEAVATAVGCAPTLVSRYARELLGEDKRVRQNAPHTAREWWVERLDRGCTVAQLADEAGLAEKSCTEKLRVFGIELLGQAYRNNLSAEKARRKRA
jgi:AraC-like DNA-binding protein